MNNKPPLITMEFHVSRAARDRYQFDQSLYSTTGKVIFANFHAARLFTQKMNKKRDLLRFPEQSVRAGQLNALGLIDEVLHFVINQYRQQKNPQITAQALDYLYNQIGEEAVNEALRRFSFEFPPLAVYRREIDLDDYLNGETGEISNRQLVLEELLMLWLANANPATAPFQELFEDTHLGKETVYPKIITGLCEFFSTQPHFGPEEQSLVEMLRSPAIAVPHSLPGQLDYIRQRWGLMVGGYLLRMLNSLDLIKEEEKPVFGTGGAGPVHVLEFRGMDAEVERFSQDSTWMPSLVLIAKNAYVWLDQLSKKYQRAIVHLDHVPDEELDTLSHWGFTSLWLIGLWERSEASKRIKQIRGNPDAVASAYSLFDYQIANDLGGEEAYRNLRDRTWQRGIRLASDMVPNHMGIDSRWVIEHPDWFISLNYSPYPAYTFDGPNLSWDNRAGIYVEDHYYNSTDAAVVFKRVDHGNGETRYIYHGNDGTSMPWNDTAQLNYLKPEVREAVIQTILHVARKFPVIRFDAAMTLAKKHFQRLWFPEPGTGGTIPTRAEYGLTKEQFDVAIPIEFWREVVDRVAQEVPGTLLLAEAFWLMEGYFVRTLGMHRVYNSAFMNMLRDEKNQEYRQVIKNTLEFDPEILKRYVNFMSNPDERTSVDQFGKGDKYFGICTLMATMPGLPMFGHGQIEGYTEKYGMEFHRAYWDEHPDPYLVTRHERELFPLLRLRHIFAEVQDFLLYDFFTPAGNVDENVFAYSNHAGEQRSLVVYHNKYADTRGYIRTSVAYSVKTGIGDDRNLIQKSLGEGLGIHPESGYFIIFRDHTSDMEYIRSSREICEQGLYVELGAYRSQVFLDFHEVQDTAWKQYSQMNAYLNGRGVPDLAQALKDIFLQPVHNAYRELVNPGMFRWLIKNRITGEALDNENVKTTLDEVEQKSINLLREINLLAQIGANETQIADIAIDIRLKTRAILVRSSFSKDNRLVPGAGINPHLDSIPEHITEVDDYVFFAWAFTHSLGRLYGMQDAAEHSRSWFDEWLLSKIIAGTLKELGLDDGTAWRMVSLVKILIRHQNWAKESEIMGSEKPIVEAAITQGKKGEGQAYWILQELLRDEEVQRYLMINRYKGVLWFNKESFEQLLGWMMILLNILVHIEAETEGDAKQMIHEVSKQVVRQLHQAMEKSDFQVEKLIEFTKNA